MRGGACRSLRPQRLAYLPFTSYSFRTAPFSSATTTERRFVVPPPAARSQEDSSSTTRQRQQRTCRVYNVTRGLVPYEQAWLWQQRLLYERMAWQRETPSRFSGHDVLLLLEHPSVYTLGRGSSLDNLRFDPEDPSCEHEVRRTERGGEVTWHGPGQIVGYPVLDLNYHKKDLHWYLRQLEEVLIRVLANLGLEGKRETEHTGVWVHDAKVAAIGLNASRWVTSHGFALNVDPILKHFEGIVPCGIQGRPVTRLCDLVSPEVLNAAGGGHGGSGGDTAADSVRSNVVKEFQNVFGMEMYIEDIDASAEELEGILFPTECEPKLLERLKADGRRQLELTRRR